MDPRMRKYFALFIAVAMMLLGPAGAFAQPTAATEADVSLKKTASSNADEGVAGDISYTLEVSNANKAATATDVVVEDEIPSGVTVVSGSLPSGCSMSGSDVTCNFGSLAAKASAS